MRRILLVLVLAAAALVLPPAPRASACSCAPQDVREALARSDGAFVGRLVFREEPQPVDGLVFSGTTVRYRYQLEQAVKGEFPSGTADVWAPASGASCGMESGMGQPTGLLLRRDGDRWTSSLCAQTRPEALVRASQPLPRPSGKAPPAVVVGTSHGPGRILSLDGLGRVVAYGDGDGVVHDVAFCGPGVLVEAFTPRNADHRRPGVAARSTSDLLTVWERPVTSDESTNPPSLFDVACGAPDGSEIVALLVESDYSQTETRHEVRIVALGRSGDARVLWRGEGTKGTLASDGRQAFVNGGPEGRSLLHVDLSDRESPAARPILDLPAGTGPLTIGPDGRYLAGVTGDPSSPGNPAPAREVLVDLTTRSVMTGPSDLGAAGRSYEALWSGAERIAFTPRWSGGGEPVRVVDLALRELASWPGWAASHNAVVGDRLVGLTRGKVMTASLASGSPAQWADLETGEPGAVAAFPGGATIGGPEQPSSTTTAPPATQPPSTASTSSTTRPRATAPLATSSTTAPPAPPAPQATVTTGAPPPLEPNPPDDDEVVARHAGGTGGGLSGRPFLAGGAGATLLAATAAAFIRRRRLPKLPELPG